jgi:trafficking protein particle complex subunit 10
VQCTDPSGIFNTFEPLLSQRFPLRNLHWKSPNRPLRAINSLHVALEQAKYGQTETQPNERRHQIPGLRQTPYLKIYLLRCDDKETYKSVCRKQIREWIKSDTQSPENKSSNNQESHDAYEYLIVHVVLPNTPAASEPRVSKNTSLESASLGATDSSDSINSTSKSKWPGKGSSTVYDKIRADFNGSSKAALERVAQVRIVKDGPAQQVTSPSLGPSELEEQWQDLVEKLKVSILSSFDRRVRQYEADIRERDSQRNLPGWNFCTFFILKEGLARGFESVGLLEDALVGYDELAVGLDVIVREEAVQEDDGQSATFLPFSKDLKSKIRNVIEAPRKGKSAPAGREEWLAMEDAFLQLDESMYPLDQRKKPYRELILSNDISVFDLRMYIFTRQEELLLRRAALSLDTTRTANNTGTATALPNQEESFLYLAQICQRAVDFLNLGAQTLRQELYRAWGGHDSQDLTHMKFQRSLIDNIVSSWVYCAALQVLTQTSSSTLAISAQTFPKAWPRSSASSSKVRRGRQTTAPFDENHEHNENQPKPSGQEPFLPTSYTNGLLSSQLQPEPSSEQSDQSKVKKAGTQELASWRAALYLLARRTIEALGRRHGWIADRNLMGKLSIVLSSSDFEELSLQNENDATKTLSDSEVSQPTGLGLEPPLIERAAKSQELFNKLYESLTYQAYSHFISAGKLKSASRTLTDMALLKYQQGNYESAASYFEHIAEDGSTDTWTILHGSMLELYADCLKRLKRVSPYLRVVLRILATYAADRRPKNGRTETSQAVQGLIDDLCKLSADLDDQIVVPMNDFVKVTSSDLRVCHHHGRDGFYIPLSIYNLLGTTLNIPSGMKMILTARDGPQVVLELRTNDSIKLMATSMEIVLESNVTTTGWYEPRRIEMAIGNIVFLEEFGANKSSQPSRPGMSLTKMRVFDHPVLLYPAVDALQARAKPPPRIYLPQPRSMLMELHSGWNDIRECTMRLKAATAGLRLQVRKAVLLDNTAPKDVMLREGTDNQSVSLSNFSSSSLCSISVPYTLENADTTSLVARVEITYVTEHGSFRHLDTLSISTILPIKVNVEDIFQESLVTSRMKIALTSRLTISPATLVPLRIEKCDIAGSEVFDVGSGADRADRAFPMDVFPKQPASLVYRFTRRQPLAPTAKEQPLGVLINFHCLDQVVLSAIEKQFLEDIASSHCAKLARPLSAHLLNKLSSQWTQEDLEVACLLQEVGIWSYEEIGWDAICAGLPRETRSEAEQWLRDWHQKHLSIPLAHTEATKRQINIPVEIPAPRILVTINLALTNVDQRHLPIAIGQPLAAMLKVRHTGGWEEGSTDAQSNATEFSYEVIASPDTWLVGGRRRGNFTVDLAEQQAFPVLLIPQRAGHLLLPSVEVKCNTPDDDNSRTAPPKSQIAYEVNYKSQAKSVLVMPNLRETTVSLDTESAAGRSLLVDSRRRQAER